VTSSEPGEGKTVTAANLAVSLARLNQRVLLIDADLRRPRLHDVFAVEQQPGLTDVLTSPESGLHTGVRATSVNRLWLMPSGTLASNPTDLLGSKRFSRLIEDLRGQFDWVVLDSPPVLAVTDASLLARVASGVLFVVGCRQTSRDAASAAIDRLGASGAHIIGAMLNRVVLDEDDPSYLPYFHRAYQSYYPAQDGTLLLAAAEAPKASEAPTGPVTPSSVQPSEEDASALAAALKASSVRSLRKLPPETGPPNPWNVG
jgi:polysaccharide biosynthesis transport protein